jgi:ABC-2 type transport system permease protein
LNRLVRSEFFKVRTIWSSWVIVLITVVLTGGFGVLVGFAPHRRAAAASLFPAKGTAPWFDDVLSAMGIATALALIFGIIAITGEYRHKTITSTLLVEPRRGHMVASKLIVSAAIGAVIAVAAGAIALLLGFAIVAGGFGNTTVMLTEYRHIFPGILVAAILYAVYGLGLGSMLKNQVLALVAGIGFEVVVTPIFVSALPSVGRYFPNQAAAALESVAAAARSHSRGVSIFGANGTHLLAWWEGGLLLLGYGLVLALAGTFTTLRADVT